MDNAYEAEFSTSYIQDTCGPATSTIKYGLPHSSVASGVVHYH